MRFSILVPTRDRPATLRHTLATIASQPGDDYEIVVADNCSSPETLQIVQALDPAKVRYTRSDEVLPMAENWERGLSLCTGEYVTVLGDDDGLVPSTLQMARMLVDATSAEIISWSPHTYWWPDTIVPWNRDILTVELGRGAIHVESRPTLEQFYKGQLQFNLIPMIYSAFFHRGIIDEARERYGGFFVPKDTAPDIASGILGLQLTQTYVHSRRPLSIRGNSGKSNGTAQWARSLGAEQREIYFREERIGLKGIIHEALVPSPNLHIIVASAMMKCKELYAPTDDTLSVDVLQVLKNMTAALDFEPEAYEDNLHDVRALAEKLRISVSPSEIPVKKEKQRRQTWGPALKDDINASRLIVNCALAGPKDVAGAALLVDALLPPAAAYFA
jgi:glycosyltransferase involved in cell wall biosynthesis